MFIKISGSLHHELVNRRHVLGLVLYPNFLSTLFLSVMNKHLRPVPNGSHEPLWIPIRYCLYLIFFHLIVNLLAAFHVLTLASVVTIVS
jgi:hypothetical protein